MRMLTVQVDQHLAGVFQLRECGGPAIDPRAALSLRVLRASQKQRRSFRGETLVREPGRNIRAPVDVEFRGKLRTLGAGTKLPQLEAVAEEERECVEQDRLARAGFSGEH